MALTLIPSLAVAKQAEKGLELRKKHGKGGTAIGVARARDLKNRKELSISTLKRMASYFARHEVDKQGKGFGDKENPSKGYIAWLLWGGDAGKKWVETRRKLFESDKK